MKCFYHQERDAVGSCKSCGKGLCPECAVDLGKGLACRGRCEDDATAVINLIEHNIKISPRAAKLLNSSRQVRGGAAIFNLLLGAVFLVWGLSDPDRLKFLIVFGVCFIGFGVYSLAKSKSVQDPREETPNPDR